MNARALFIGGPLDGEVRAVGALEHYYDALQVDHPPSDMVPTDLPQEASFPVTRVIYRRRDIYGVSLWAPQTMTNTAILELLAARYERALS